MALDDRGCELVFRSGLQSRLDHERRRMETCRTATQFTDGPLRLRRFRPVLRDLDENVEHRDHVDAERPPQPLQCPLRRRAQDTETDRRGTAEGDQHGQAQLRYLVHAGLDELGDEVELKGENAQRAGTRAEAPDVDRTEDQNDEHRVRHDAVRSQDRAEHQCRQGGRQPDRQRQRLVAEPGFGDRDHADHRRQGAGHQLGRLGSRRCEDAERQHDRADRAQGGQQPYEPGIGRREAVPAIRRDQSYPIHASCCAPAPIRCSRCLGVSVVPALPSSRPRHGRVLRTATGGLLRRRITPRCSRCRRGTHRR